VSQLAYSYLPKDKNNKASSLTNLFRNQGASFGIAFVTTVLARRAQYHQAELVTHVTNFDQTLTANLAGIANRFVEHGTAQRTPRSVPSAQVHAILQATMLGFLDCFWILGLMAFLGVPLTLFIRKFKQGGSAATH
jgi:DHA2 family multidrug resistance protein